MIDVIHFYRVEDLDAVSHFYGEVLDLPLDKDQGVCLIYDCHGHGKIGFCTHHPKQPAQATCITFVYDTQEAVDAMHAKVKPHVKSLGEPTVNEQFRIYHFFARDHAGLTLEFQVFL